MGILLWLVMIILFLSFLGGVAILVVLLIDRIKKRDSETFERRKY
ncbi:MAG: hypothetical protein R6W67_02980 [Bacteroidales bacterium]